ncbi:MAG: hypothetical protein PHX92_02600 [Candidatus Pacebacteria bacterium]|nr:hypothetical protein [Candidatus Paceibacterota bacterium]
MFDNFVHINLDVFIFFEKPPYVCAHYQKLLHTFKDDEEKTKIIRKSCNKQLIIEKKKEYFKWVPLMVGIIEYLFFSLVTIFVFDFEFILKCFAGWMAIKCIGGYTSWSDTIFGRANFYTFLLCSIFNVSLALLSGLIIREIIGLI